MRSIMDTSRRALTAAAALAALASVAQAQYQQYGAPYAPTPAYRQPAQPIAYGQPGQPIQQPGQPIQAAQPQYAATGVYQGYTPGAGYAAAGAGYPTPGMNYPTSTPNYTAPYNVPRVAMAYQNGVPAAAQSSENLPLTPPAESIAPGNGGYVPQPVPTPDNYTSPTPGYPAPAMGGAGCNCQGGGAGYESYPAASGQDATAYGACNPYSNCNTCTPECCAPARCRGFCFGGVYGLMMDRDASNKYPLAFTVPSSMPDGYPPQNMNLVMTTRDVDSDFQPGLELRLGYAFGGCCDPCSCCCTGPQWGVEGAYWTLFDEDEATQYTSPTAPSRTYTMMPMYGLEYDGGSGYNPVNAYWDHGMPSVNANTYRVTTVRQRSSFEAQNLELNLLKLGTCGGGCGTAAIGPSAGGSVGYGCDSCSGCCESGCCAPRRSRYSCTALCGFRWLQLDEDFLFGVDYTGGSNGFLNYNANVENNLVGAQLGCNGMYRIGCKWGLHIGTAVGVYGNDIDVRQYFQSPTGQVRYIGSPTENFDVNANKTDVAMLGELRVGGSYQCTCHCRVYGGWRAMGITGIALATDQTPNAFLNSAQLANYVNSNGSMILHGLQAGVEWNY